LLKSLSIRNILLIEKAEISFSDGLNVFTGETGAGKSIVLDCLSFVLCQKTRDRFLRSSCDNGEVVAEFILNNSKEVLELLNQLSIPFKSSVIIRRVEFKDGRRKAYVNDINCTIETIQKLGTKMMEFVDQKDGSLVLKKKNHVRLLDDFSGNKTNLSSLNIAWENLKNKEKEITNIRNNQLILKQELDFVNHSLKELKKLNPQPGEIEDLELLRNSLKSSSKIKVNLQETLDLISSSEVRSRLIMALKKLEKVSELFPKNSLLDDTVLSLDGLIHDLDDIEKNLPILLEGTDTQEMTLEEVEDRLFNLRNIARKHGVMPEDLMTLNDELDNRLTEYNGIEEKIRELHSEQFSIEKEYKVTAKEISNKRRTGGKNLDQMMIKELAPLKMEGVKFTTLLEDKNEKGPNGYDRVTFQICNHGIEPKDLEKIASGGELSRILLALKVCLVTNTSGITLVFDEIDRGIGGATAEAVGNRLASLAKKEQLILVTHSPQVASKASRHWSVKKVMDKEKQPVTFLNLLDKTASKTEVARMISGEVVSKEALAAAQKLMD